MSSYIIKLSENSALLVQGCCIYGVNKISVNELFFSKKDNDWKYGRKNITLPFDNKEILKEFLTAVLNVSQEDPNTFKTYDKANDNSKKSAQKNK